MLHNFFISFYCFTVPKICNHNRINLFLLYILTLLSLYVDIFNYAQTNFTEIKAKMNDFFMNLHQLIDFLVELNIRSIKESQVH